MKTIISTDYHASFEAQVTAEKAFADICKVSAWWTKNIEGSTQNLNDVFTVTFGETFSKIKIGELIAGKKILWEVLDCNLHWMHDKKEWKGTQILWEISKAGKVTRIDMTHIGLRPGIECFEDCNKGWNHYVTVSLFKLVTEAKGVPDHANHSGRTRQ